MYSSSSSQSHTHTLTLRCTAVPEGSASPSGDHWAPGRLHGEGMRWNRTSDRIMAAPLGRDTLPEHWSYGVCEDGRVFFIKWAGLTSALSHRLSRFDGSWRGLLVFPSRWCNRCFSSPLSLSLSLGVYLLRLQRWDADHHLAPSALRWTGKLRTHDPLR